MKSLMPLAMVITLILLGLPVFASTTIGYCKTLGSADMIYVLNQSIINYAGSCFTISATNVTLDCDGYTIDGISVISYHAFVINADNFTAKNCMIKQFGSGFSTSATRNYLSIDSVNSSYNQYGIYIPNICNYCNVTNSIFSFNTLTYNTYFRYIYDGYFSNITVKNAVGSYGFYIRDSNRNAFKDFTVSDNARYGFHISSSHGNSFESFVLDNNKGRAFYIHGDNSTAKNIYANNTGEYFGLGYGVYVSGTNNTISDSMSENSYEFDFFPSTTYCKSTHVSNITVTGGYPFEFYNSTSTIQDKKFGILYLCNASNSVIDNVTSDIGNNGIVIGKDSYNVNITNYQCNGCHTGIFAGSYGSLYVGDSSLNAKNDGITLGSSFNLVAENVTIRDAPRYGIVTGSNMTIRNVYIYSPSLESGIENSGNVTFNIYDSVIFANNSAITLDNGWGRIVEFNVYNSKLNRSSSLPDSGNYHNGSVNTYCSGIPYGKGYINLYNTTITDYRLQNGTLEMNKYWYLSVTNPLSANAIIKDVFSSTVSTFSDSRTVPLLEYQVTEFNNKTDQTPHTIQATKTGYNPLSPYSLTMNQNRVYVVSLSAIPSGVPSGIEGLLTATGEGLGGFLTAITDPTVNIVLALGIIGGLLALFYAIASVIKKAVGGATSQL